MKVVAKRPVTAVYVSGVAAILLITQRTVTLTEGVLFFGVAAALFMMCTVYIELRRVHQLLLHVLRARKGGRREYDRP